MAEINGLLLVDKPIGWTSFDVVAKTRGLLKAETGQKRPKVGHTGTLDPLATGLLVLTIGSYCKRADRYSKLNKTYQAELKLGQISSTDDEEGEKTAVSELQPETGEVSRVLEGFIGQQQQLPPAFSAIKVDGQRAYKLARQGKAVELKPRTVTIHQIADIEYDYPVVRFTTDVSSGTYIRSLARDIGEKLGVGAYLSGLRRTQVGQFGVTSAVSLDQLAGRSIASLTKEDERSHN